MDLNKIKGIRNPLYIAAKKDRVEFAGLLIKRGADVNCIIYNNISALSVVTSLKMLHLFLSHGAKIELGMGDEGVSLLINLVRTGESEAVDKLLEIYGLNIDDIYPVGDANVTPLIAAVMADRYEMVKHLLEVDANPNVEVIPMVHQNYKTAMEAASYRICYGYKKQDIKDILIQYGATK